MIIGDNAYNSQPEQNYDKPLNKNTNSQSSLDYKNKPVKKYKKSDQTSSFTSRVQKPKTNRSPGINSQSFKGKSPSSDSHTYKGDGQSSGHDQQTLRIAATLDNRSYHDQYTDSNQFTIEQDLQARGLQILPSPQKEQVKIINKDISNITDNVIQPHQINTQIKSNSRKQITLYGQRPPDLGKQNIHLHVNLKINHNESIPTSSKIHARIQNKSSKITDFTIIKSLGEGSYSTVYKVRRNIDQKYYALKKVKLFEAKEQSQNSTQIFKNYAEASEDQTKIKDPPNIFSDKERENSLNEVRILASVL